MVGMDGEAETVGDGMGEEFEIVGMDWIEDWADTDVSDDEGAPGMTFRLRIFGGGGTAEGAFVVCEVEIAETVVIGDGEIGWDGGEVMLDTGDEVAGTGEETCLIGSGEGVEVEEEGVEIGVDAGEEVNGGED